MPLGSSATVEVRAPLAVRLKRIGGRKSVCKGLIERLFPAVAFSLLAIGMILIRFALRLGNYFGSPIAAQDFKSAAAQPKRCSRVPARA